MSSSSVTEKTGANHTYRTPTWVKVSVAVLVVLILATAHPAFTEEMHKPGIADFFPTALFGEGTFFAFSRITLARFIAGALVCLVIGLGARAMRRIPSRPQQLLEMGAEFVRRQVGVEVLGEARGRRWAPFLAFLFFGVLAMNLTGIVPGINIAASSVMAVPLVFAAISWVVFIGAGIREQGLGRFLRTQLFPAGVPAPLYLLLTPIEAFSTFVVRPVTLAIRLLANMISGHLLLAITFFGTSALLAASPSLKGLALLTIGSTFIVTLFEAFIAVLQAYIFSILTAVYIMLSVQEH